MGETFICHRRKCVRVRRNAIEGSASPPEAIAEAKSTRGARRYKRPILESNRGDSSFDIYSRLFRERIVFVSGEVNDEIASRDRLKFFLDFENPRKPIDLYINSYGGVVTSGLAMYDTMQFITSPVRTLCVGTARSMGSFLLMAGASGERAALPNASLQFISRLAASRPGFQLTHTRRGEAANETAHHPPLRPTLRTNLRKGQADAGPGPFHGRGTGPRMGTDRPRAFDPRRSGAPDWRADAGRPRPCASACGPRRSET